MMISPSTNSVIPTGQAGSALLRRLIADRIEYFLPALEVGRHALAAFGGRRGLHVEAEFGHLLLDLGQLEHGTQLGAPRLDQRRRRLGRREEDVPAQDADAGIAELGDGRDLWRRGGGLLARGEDDLHLAGAVVFEEIGDAAAAGRDMDAL